MDIRAYSGAIYDIIKFDLGYEKNFVLPKDIKPLYNFKGFVFGRVFTAVGQKTKYPELDMINQMIASFKADSVYVLQANDNSRAHFGDIMASFTQRAGVKGAVIQGWTRDAERIEDKGFKMWCKGVQPQDSSDRWNITSYGCEIVIGNIFISPHDYIFADRDGVLVINYSIVDKVLALLPAKLDYEEEIRQAIDDGMSATQIYKEIGKW